MDDRFPNYLRWLARKFEFFAVPNLGMLIAGLAILGFIGIRILGAPMERFVFDPDLVMQGEWWRLFAFPVMNDPIWLLFFVMFVHYTMMTLETAWGTSPLTLFTFLSYCAALGASFLSHRPLSIWVHVMENISLAFGTLFPEVEFYLFFVLPVKAKWLALFAGALFFLQFLVGDATQKLFLVMVLSPYLLFFGPYVIRIARRMMKERR
jgi:hypothetical protein